jgi:hypothetical protein
MSRLCKLLLTAGLLPLLFALGDRVRAEDVSGGANCGRPGIGGRLSAWFHYEPNVTWYVPYPYWWPQYFGPSHTDYQFVQYWTPPAETALMVKERIRAINGANPILLSAPNESLPFPKIDKNEVPKINKNETPGKLP